jgi:hypothetical protein
LYGDVPIRCAGEDVVVFARHPLQEQVTALTVRALALDGGTRLQGGICAASALVR